MTPRIPHRLRRRPPWECRPWNFDCDSFFSIRLAVRVEARRLPAGVASAYRGVILREGSPEDPAFYRALPDDPGPWPIVDGAPAGPRGAERWVRHLVVLDRRLSAGEASRRLWHEMVHAGQAERDPLGYGGCREDDAEALIARHLAGEAIAAEEIAPLSFELRAIAAERLHDDLGPLVADRDPDAETLPLPDALRPRIQAAWDLPEALHPEPDEPFDEAAFEAELRAFAIELGLDPDADPDAEPAPAPEPTPPADGDGLTIAFGGLAVWTIPGDPLDDADQRVPLSEVAALAASGHRWALPHSHPRRRGRR
jgi:hypothetical protein